MFRRLLILILILFFINSCLQAQDSIPFQTKSSDTSALFDSTNNSADSSLIPFVAPPPKIESYQKILQGNKWLQVLKAPQADPVRLRHPVSQDLFFYILLAISIFFGILKLTFPRYFSNIFRVFFNTSLRQIQLTDQLLQSTWSSILYNILFFFSAGLLIFVCLQPYFPDTGWSPLVFYLLAVLFLTIMYTCKFIWLNFFSWVTGMRRELDGYVFIIFLTNKILGVLLLGFLPFLLFAEKNLAAQLQILVFAGIGFFLIIRFLKAYSLVRSQIHISVFHFLIYLAALEILPIFLAGRLALILLEKKM